MSRSTKPMAKDTRTRLGSLQELKRVKAQFSRWQRRQKAAASASATPADTQRDREQEAERKLFEQAMRGVQPLPARHHQRSESAPPPPAPLPLKTQADELEVLFASLNQLPDFEDRLELGEEAAFLRPGLTRKVLLDLRRGRWVTQAELDLHGLNRDQARLATATFLTDCLHKGHRCVRIIHGKGLGSPGQQSILKQLVRGWLAQREEILAFCQAPDSKGGSGAVVVLLRAQSAKRR